MANLRNYSRSVVAAASILTPDIKYVGQVVDNQGTVLGDFSAGITLVTILKTLTAQQGLDFADVCSAFLLKVKFPSAFP